MRTKQRNLLPAALLRLAAALLWLTATLLPTACISEPLVESAGEGDGSTARVTLSVRGERGERDERSERGEESLPPSRSLTPEQEGLIDNLHILVFDDAGALITNEHFAGLAIRGMGSVSFETLPGVNRQLFVVANGDVNDDTNGQLDAALRAVKTLDELKALQVKVKGNGLRRDSRLTMVGSTIVTITKPHAEAISIELHYLAAKVTVSVKDNITSPLLGITITGWDVVNIPKQTYLRERTGDDQQDAVTGTRPGDYLATAGKYSFEKVDATNKTWSQSFYVFENRRGGRENREYPVSKYPDMSVDDNDQRGKAWYAPAGATYMLIYGTHERDGQTNNIVYKIYLGENEVNNYDLSRGRHYAYNVTINGLDDINIDTNVEWGSASFSVDTSDNLLMDAHPDFRVLRIGGTAVDATTMAYATVEVLEPDGTTPCEWLAVSPLNLYRHGIKQSGNEHQQFAPDNGTGSFVRAKYTPTPTAESTLANSTFGMTRRLTRISFEQPAVYTYQNVILYADALDVPDTERRAKVKITYYKGSAGDVEAGVQTLDVSQRGLIQVSNSLYMERYEESAMLMHPGLASGIQGTQTMQWGYNDSFLYGAEDRYSNGNYLTANAVYNQVDSRNGMTAPQWVANTYADYREKYPHQGVQVTEPSALPVADRMYYYPALESTTPPSDYFHPVFNSSAARYCHEKNRDTTGDGVISKEETFWYLPSYADMVAVKKNPPDGLTGTYWTSTEESTDKSWAITFPTGAMMAADKKTTYRVRCVRGAGTVLPDATMESGETADKTKINLSPVAGSNRLFEIADDKDFGLQWTVTSDAPDWLKIATTETGTGAGTTQKGTGNATLYAYAASANSSETQPRTANFTLTRKGMAATPKKTIEVSQAYFPPISKKKKSNCYMVTLGGSVDIPVERANESYIGLTGSIYCSTSATYYQLLSNTSWTASIVWQSSVNLLSLSNSVGIGPLGNFKVHANSTPGNALVAIKNASDEILWSWHIWITDYAPDATNDLTIFKTNNGYRDYIFMDRALGATSAIPGQLNTCGLLYQWGRKDPFPGAAQGDSWSIPNGTDPILVYSSSNTPYSIPKESVLSSAIPNNLTNAIRHPDTFYYAKMPPSDWFVYNNSGYQNTGLWSGSKTIFDPCPIGWHVAPWVGASPFQGLSGISFSNYGGNWGTNGYFPAMGSRNEDNGNFFNVGTGGLYWMATTSSIYSYYFTFSIGEKNPANRNNRSNGCSIRCCHE